MTTSERLIKKNFHIIRILRENNLDFNHLFILECYMYPEDKERLSFFEIPSIKDFNISIAHGTLVKEEYLVEDPNDTSKTIISLKGKNLINDLIEDKPGIGGESFILTLTEDMFTRVSGKQTEDEMFEEWWKTYPTSSRWETEDKSAKFEGSRALKNLRKTDAKKRYLKLLNQGLDHKELLGGLKYEVKIKKLDSIKKSENQMDYIKGMESYLNQER